MRGTKIAIWTMVFMAAAMEYACAAPIPTPPTGTVFPFYAYGSPYYNPVQYYVVAERRGTDVVWNSFTMSYEATSRVIRLQAEVKETVQSNASARKQVSVLKFQAGQLKAAAAQQTDLDKKAVLLNRMNVTLQSIKDTQAQIRPVVQWVGAGPLSWRGMQDFLTRLARESGPANVHTAGTPPAARAGY
jgi:hypothetical protein